jgi:hypothetical protein
MNLKSKKLVIYEIREVSWWKYFGAIIYIFSCGFTRAKHNIYFSVLAFVC